MREEANTVQAGKTGPTTTEGFAWEFLRRNLHYRRDAERFGVARPVREAGVVIYSSSKIAAKKAGRWGLNFFRRAR